MYSYNDKLELGTDDRFAHLDTQTGEVIDITTMLELFSAALPIIDKKDGWIAWNMDDFDVLLQDIDAYEEYYFFINTTTWKEYLHHTAYGVYTEESILISAAMDHFVEYWNYCDDDLLEDLVTCELGFAREALAMWNASELFNETYIAVYADTLRWTTELEEILENITRNAYLLEDTICTFSDICTYLIKHDIQLPSDEGMPGSMFPDDPLGFFTELYDTLKTKCA